VAHQCLSPSPAGRQADPPHNAGGHFNSPPLNTHPTRTRSQLTPDSHATQPALRSSRLTCSGWPAGRFPRSSGGSRGAARGGGGRGTLAPVCGTGVWRGCVVRVCGAGVWRVCASRPGALQCTMCSRKAASSNSSYTGDVRFHSSGTGAPGMASPQPWCHPVDTHNYT
jgi:hypothetical protein